MTEMATRYPTPAMAARTKVSLRPAGARASSAECSANTPGTLWQVRKGPDVKIASFQADASGRATLRSPRRMGQYYVTVAANYVPGVVECGAAQSKSVKVKPAKRKRKRTK